MKTFVLSDSGLNGYGFRVLTSGIDVPQFQRNPIMLWMHSRPVRGGSSDQVLPLGVWKNIRVEGDKLLAEPEFDQRDSFATRIKDKVEAGMIRMASIGILDFELDESPALKVPGQTLGTVTRCSLLEASIVDVGANPNAVALYAGNSGNPLPVSSIPLHLALLSNGGAGFDDIVNDPAFALSYDQLHNGPELGLLMSRNYPLYCLKYFQQFEKFPNACKLDSATQQRLIAISRNTELMALKAQSYDQLHQSGKLVRLKELDRDSYWQKRLTHV